MDYAEFKVFLSEFLWKSTDTALIASLDNLIRMGNNTINRKLKSTFRDGVVAGTLIGEMELELPVDYDGIGSFSCPDTSYPGGEFTYLEPGDLYQRRSDTQTQRWQQVYSINNRKVLLSGPADELNYIMTYKTKIPLVDAADVADNWWFDDYLDAYVYAVLKHTAPFLREDERVQIWGVAYAEAIADIEEHYEFHTSRGQQGNMPLGRAAGVRRKGDRNTDRYYE